MAVYRWQMAGLEDGNYGVDTTTAVADVATAVADTSVADQPFIQSDASVVGDTASDTDAVGFEAGDSAVAAARRQQRRAPVAPVHGVAPPREHRPGKHNKEPEVGNFGLFFGNWGLRGTLGGPPRSSSANTRPRSPNPEEPCASGDYCGGL